MSGIVGVWNLDGEPLEAARLAACSARLAHRGLDGEGRWVRGAVGLACQLSRVTPESRDEEQPAVDAAGRRLVFDGRLDDRAELLAALDAAADVQAAAPDAALVLAAYRAWGDAFAGRLVGDYAFGLFDPAGPRLLLGRDAIGVRPLYYTRAGDTFVFGSEIKALLAHPRVARRPDADLLATYLLNGDWDPAGRTLFEGVRYLVPSHVAIVTPAGTTLTRVWDFDGRRQIRLGSDAEYAEGFRACFERAVRRRLRSAWPVAISVSGGLDSSSILAVARTLARRAPDAWPPVLGYSYTFPPGTPADEADFVAALDHRHGRIETFPAPPAGVLSAPAEAVWHIEAPIMDEQWESGQAVLGRARAAGARVVLTGHWGDQILCPQGYLLDLFRGLAWRRLAVHFGQLGRWNNTARRVFVEKFLRDLAKEALPRRLIALLRRFRPRQHEPWYTKDFRARASYTGEWPADGVPFLTAHARNVYAEARSPFYMLCMEWENKAAAMHGLDFAVPFLDRDLIQFLMAIPGDVQTRDGVFKALLRDALRDLLPERIATRATKADFTDFVNDGVRREGRSLADCFGPGAAAVRRGFLDADVLRTELGRLAGAARPSDVQLAWSLSDLVGLEYWLRTFFDGDKGESAWPRQSDETGSPIGRLA
jgi:asparagine synthase (glutamine-hydrolysing)